MPSSRLFSELITIRNLQQQGQLDSAISLCLENLKIKSDFSLIALLGVLYCQQQAFEQGRACLEKIAQNPENLSAQILTDIAAIHLLLKEPVLALQKLQQTLQFDPAFYLAHARRGFTYQYSALRVVFRQKRNRAHFPKYKLAEIVY